LISIETLLKPSENRLMTDWYHVSNADTVNSPALLIYPDRVRNNLRQMIAVAGDVSRLRPHIKTHKMPQVIQLKREAGIHKFKVSTIAEAEMTAAAGGEDVLLAIQPVGPNIGRLVNLIGRFPATHFAALVDDFDNLQAINSAAAAADTKIELYVDLNVGMNRTGLPPGPDAAALYRQIVQLPAVTPGGLHAYDGHLHNTDHSALSAAVDAAFRPVLQLRDSLVTSGCPVPRIIASGTPTFPLLAQHDNIEVGCGTTVLWDFGQAAICPDLRFEFAALLLTRVISKPLPDRLCIDLGHKAVASEMPHPRVRLLGLEDAEVVTHSEEHLVVKTERAAEYRVGDVIYGIPRHICPTVALHQEVVVVQNGLAADRWPVVARVRRISI
jgi:D-serine deaminase-like pyridoxal phosphate-dependent protein